MKEGREGGEEGSLACESYHERGRGSVDVPKQALELEPTKFSSEIRTKLRDWAVWQAMAGCYSRAALSPNDSKLAWDGMD